MRNQLLLRKAYKGKIHRSGFVQPWVSRALSLYFDLCALPFVLGSEDLIHPLIKNKVQSTKLKDQNSKL